MLRPEEKTAQIEAALRIRFFPFVLKVETPNRTDWTEERHDTDRLSRALAAFALVLQGGVDDVTAAQMVSDGENDGGIDAFLFDRNRNHLIFVQSKFKKHGVSPSQDENNKTLNGIKALQNRRFAQFNAAFQTRRDEIEEAFNTPGVKIVLVHVFLGDTFSPHVAQDLVAACEEANILSQVMEWKAVTLSTLHDGLMEEQEMGRVTAEIVLENWSLIATPQKAVYGQIGAAALSALVEKEGKRLFERNIRYYLGSLGVNAAIEETVRRRPREFFYLNNGITAVASKIVNAPGTPQKCKFSAVDFSIVNGAQTAGAIANASVTGTISPDAKILITLIEIGDAKGDFGRKITEARNRQNAVRGIHFAALDPTQERLRKELKIIGIDYFYRPSAEARIARTDAFTVENAAVALACCSFRVLSSNDIHQLKSQGKPVQNAVEFVVAAKREISRLWEQESSLYQQLFRENLSGLRLYRIVQMYRFVDAILAESDRTEQQYSRRTFFRHGRCFITAFVAHCVPKILEAPAVLLSEPEKGQISQLVNELAERIYAASDSSERDKGYLGTFQNLTHTQPLADKVLARLQ